MKVCISFLLGLFFSFQSFSSDKVDSLKMLINTNGIPSLNKPKAYEELIRLYLESNFDSAYFYFSKYSDESFEINDPLLKVSLLSLESQIMLRLEEDENSMIVIERIFQIADSLKIQRISQIAFNTLAIYYESRRNFNKAIEASKSALEFSDKNNFSEQINLLYNLGILYSNINLDDSAFLTFNKALKLAKENNYELGEAIVYSGLSTLYFKIGNNIELLNAAQKSVKIFRKFGNSYQLSSALNTLGLANYQLGNKNEAIDNFIESLKYANLTKADIIPSIYNNLDLTYFSIGDYKNAHLYLDSFVVALEESYKKRIENLKKNAEIKFEVQRKNASIELLNEKNAAGELKLSRQRYLIIGAIGLLILLIGITFLLSSNLKLKKQTNKLLLLENQLEKSKRLSLELENQKLESSKLSLELETLKSKINPHFLFNSINVINSLISRDKEKAIVFTERYSEFLRRSIEINENNFVKINKELALASDYAFLQQTRFDQALKVYFNVSDDYLKALIPPFSIQIALENAVKHNIISNQNNLEVFIYSEDKYILIKNLIRAKRFKEKGTGLGIKLIRDRYQLLKSLKPEFYEKEGYYFVKLPIINDENLIENEQ